MAINLADHVVEIDGTKYIPFDIAVKAVNNIFTEDITKTISDLESKLTDSINDLNNVNLDD